jgi:hypothetical protein
MSPPASGQLGAPTEVCARAGVKLSKNTNIRKLGFDDLISVPQRRCPWPFASWRRLRCGFSSDLAGGEGVLHGIFQSARDVRGRSPRLPSPSMLAKAPRVPALHECAWIHRRMVSPRSFKRHSRGTRHRYRAPVSARCLGMVLAIASPLARTTCTPARPPPRGDNPNGQEHSTISRRKHVFILSHHGKPFQLSFL